MGFLQMHPMAGIQGPRLLQIEPVTALVIGGHLWWHTDFLIEWIEWIEQIAWHENARYHRLVAAYFERVHGEIAS